MKLTIGYFYPHYLNLYGDNGNVEILVSRAQRRGFDVEVVEINPITHIDTAFMKNINIVVMGGGPDSGQKLMYNDLVSKKGPYLKDYIEAGGVGLYICGSYQLLGHYYKSADGSVLDGLGIFDLYTQHFGINKPRCIGNMICKLNNELLNDSTFVSVNHLDDLLVGFENHGGRTFLGSNVKPLAHVIMGHGNNSQDQTEGVLYKNSIGTYCHGPILARNPHLADYLIAQGSRSEKLAPLDDYFINLAHNVSQKLRQ